MARHPDPQRLIRYPLTWPAWLSERVAKAASGRAMSVAAWLRLAALEKLERDTGTGGEPGKGNSLRETLDDD